MHHISPPRWIAVLAALLALALAGCRPVQPVSQAGAAAQAPAAQAPAVTVAATAVPTVVPAVTTGKVAANWTPPPLSANVTVYFDAFDDQGRLYVLEMSNGETETPALGTGRVVRINKDGLRDIMATGLSMPAGITFGPDGALYATQYAYDLEPGRPHAGKGQVVRIDVRQPVASRR